MKLFGILLFSLLLTKGCEDKQQQQGNLQGEETEITAAKTMQDEQSFEIQTLYGDQDVSEHKMTIILKMDEHMIYGKSACNQYSGSFKMDGDKVSFAPFMMTKMYCQDKMDIENAMSQAFTAATNFRFTDTGNLELLDDYDNIHLTAKSIEIGH